MTTKEEKKEKLEKLEDKIIDKLDTIDDTEILKKELDALLLVVQIKRFNEIVTVPVE